MFRKAVFGRKGLVAAVQQATGIGAGSGGGEHDLGGLNDELDRLDLFAKGLGRHARRWVATGEPAHFLSQLEDVTAKYPRGYGSPYSSDSIAVNAVQGTANVALVTGAVSDAMVIRRFIAIRRIVRPLASSAGWGQQPFSDEEMPLREFLTALSQGDSKLNSHSAFIKPTPDLVPVLRPRQVLDLLLQVGGTTAFYFSNEGLRADRLFARRDDFRAEFAALARENPRDFAEAITARDNEAHIKTMVSLAELLGVLPLGPIMAKVFGLLGKGRAKPVRDHTIPVLARLEPAMLAQAVQMGLAEGELEMRYDLTQVAGRSADPAVLDKLRAHLPGERSGKVKGAIEAILEGHATAPAPDVIAGEGARIPLANGEALVLEPVDASLLRNLSEDDRPQFHRLVAMINARREAVSNDGQERKEWQLETLRPISPAEADGLFVYLLSNGVKLNEDRHLRFTHDLTEKGASEEMLDWCKEASPALLWNVLLKLTMLQGFKPLVQREYFDKTIAARLFAQAVSDGLDPLAVAALSDTTAWHASLPLPSHQLAIRHWLTRQPNSYWRPFTNPLTSLPVPARQRIIAASLAQFDEALGLASSQHSHALDHACEMLADLPAVPERYVPRLVELGLAGKRPEREMAQPLLANASGLDKRLVDALEDRRQDVRAHAATWLADLRITDSEKALRKRLKKEKAESVRAALIEALLRLGADLSDVIGPAALVAEAGKAGGKLDLPEWLTPELLPQVHFADGTPAPSGLVAYWVGLAVKLKDPGNTGLFGIYLDQLRAEDARLLSGRILQGWIDFDTYGPTMEEATAYAQDRVDQLVQSRMRRMASGMPMPPGDFEQRKAEMFEYYRRAKLNEKPNTGTKSKGALALACRAEPSFAAEKARWFLKKHGRRSHQAMALLDMLAGMESPTAMQVVIAAATRLKQKSTMAHANAIAERYAKDRGWSYDELADRTVPTAGFDDEGVLDLPCGEDAKPYCARLDENLAIHIYNPAGKVVQSLPAGDDEDTKDSKKALSAARKELKQIVAMQSDRLLEAMASERRWPVGDWLEAFHGHPVMRRLIERLVWQGLDTEGNVTGLFRPTQEGDFTDAADEPVDLDGFASVQLAHAALMDDATADAWRQHLKDYRVKPLLGQLPAGFKPLGGAAQDATQISDRFGWVGESLSYRGLAEKRGYSRAMGDGGGCIAYEKPFPAHGLIASIENSGSNAYDENNPVVIKHLTFRRTDSWGALPLAEVPPVLLAICHDDLHAIAAKGAYAEDWEKRVDW